MRPKAIRTHSISEYIQKNQDRKNAYWRITDNGNMFWYKHKFYPEKLFDIYYPLYEYFPYNDKGDLIGKNYLL